MKGRLFFALYVFGPMFLIFFLPLLFVRLPLVVSINRGLATVPTPFALTALVVCLVWFAIAAGLVVWPVRADRPARSGEWTAHAVWWAFVAFSSAGSGVSLLHAFHALPAGIEEIVHQLSLAPPIGFVLGAWLLRRGVARNRSTAVRGLLIVDLIVSLLVPVVLSKVGPAVFSAIAILYGLRIVGISWRRQAAAVLLLVPLIVVAFPFREYLRMQVYNGDPFHRRVHAGAGAATSSVPPVHLTFSQRLAFFDPVALGLRFHRASGLVLLAQFAASRAILRINRLADLAYVIQATPATVPYAGGATYAPLVTKFVPRFLWPDKPRELAGQFYGHRYPFLDLPDTVHSVNLPMVTEGWVNAGWVGVVLSAAAVGLVLRVIWTRWIGPDAAPGNLVLGMAVVGTAVNAESNLSLVLGGVLHALLVYGALTAAIAWSDRTAVRRNPDRGTL